MLHSSIQPDIYRQLFTCFHLHMPQVASHGVLLFLVMDEFVCEKLTEWKLSELIPSFQEQGIDEESLYDLTDEDISNLITKVGPRAKFKKRLKLLKEKFETPQETDHFSVLLKGNEETAEDAQVLPNPNETDKGKRKSVPHEGTSRFQLPMKRRRETSTEEKLVLSKAKEIMKRVKDGLPKTELNDFLSEKIHDLETEKKELVGVFGRTGAGKSSLINTLIGERNLLPSGDLNACTTVIIKVEANMKNKKYEAEIEFISKEDLEDDLQGLKRIALGDADNEEENDDASGDSGYSSSFDDNVSDEDVYNDAVEVLSALYGARWDEICASDDFMNRRHFREIPEFLESGKKTLAFDSPEMLSRELVKYTRSVTVVCEGEDTRRWFWPLVKCVTIRVPNNDFLQHVTLVDLPGAGDRNKRRDNMWKEVVGNCSTVWVVAEINRALAEKEPWEILENASSDMGNGGQCQRIHFICTKSDIVKKSRDQSAADVRSAILARNKKAKEGLMKEFRKQNIIRKHFSDECFKVFAVSSTEFQEREWLKPEDTEIPKLLDFLQDLSDRQSETETLNYVSGAKGILSLIQGARCGEVSQIKEDVRTVLKINLEHGLLKVSAPILKAITAFQKCLNNGVENSKSSCDRTLKFFLYPKGKARGRGFHRTLKCVVANNGVCKTTKGKHLNLNEKLTAKLKESIDEEFRKTFPNESKQEPFNGAISCYSVITEAFVEKYKDVTAMQLRLEYLRTEEIKIKTQLHKDIQKRKKAIYNSLTKIVTEKMLPCYQDAQQCEGRGSLKNMRNIIERHVNANKSNMFEEATNMMLRDLHILGVDILKKLKNDMLKAIECSLRTYSQSLPDVKGDLERVTKYCKILKKNTNKETSPTSADQPGPSTARVRC
ncbi:nuclear GTPase SLIP-GC-like isoform X2 [Cheilinus undulatus]|uniref:nuclear GTPase SLIP-GC-like isoform X2 n=1 Tax=Cheilinus undulatus TaxID=241271 RepID=UPI001BD626EA|nr:nuclear GTPase SLIP-GC-like isoform X2 [Cheilinus undulatus]